jgi:hypothetical protein
VNSIQFGYSLPLTLHHGLGTANGTSYCLTCINAPRLGVTPMLQDVRTDTCWAMFLLNCPSTIFSSYQCTFVSILIFSFFFTSKFDNKVLVLNVEDTWCKLTGIVNKLAANLMSQVRCFPSLIPYCKLMRSCRTVWPKYGDWSRYSRWDSNQMVVMYVLHDPPTKGRHYW